MGHDAKRPKFPPSKDEKEVNIELADTIGELEERLTEINSFDQAEMVNFQCDDLIIEVSLAVQSQIEHLNKLEAGFLKQIEQHRAERLEELSSGLNGKRLAEMKNRIEIILSRIQELTATKPQVLESEESSSLEAKMNEALEEANDLLLRASLLMSKMKRDYLNQAMRFEENQQFLNSNDIVGKLDKANVVDDSYKLSKFKPFHFHQLESYRTSGFGSYRASIRAIAFIRDDTLAFSTMLSSKIVIWNLEDVRFLSELNGHKDEVSCLAVLHNGWLASGSRDKTINIWNVDTRTLIRTLKGHEDSIFSLLVLPNGNLASLDGHLDSSIKIWNPCNHENSLIHSIKIQTDNSIDAIGVLSNGFLVGYSTEKLHLFNPCSGRIVKSISSHTDESNMSSMLVLKDDRVAVTLGLGDELIEIFDLLDLENKSVITKKQENASLKVFAQLPDGLIASSFNHKGGSKIIFRDSQCGTEVSTIQTNTYTYHTAMAVSKDGRFLAVGDFMGTIKTWLLTD